MIKIIGDTPEELAVLHSYISTGAINTRKQDLEQEGLYEYSKLDVHYSLGSGNSILTGTYPILTSTFTKIIGERLPDGTARLIINKKENTNE